MKKTKTLIITAAAVSMFALAACTQTATEDKNVQTTQAQIDVQKDRTVNLTQDDSYPESYREEVLQTIQTVQDDITGESVSYIFITDLHFDTSEETETAAFRHCRYCQQYRCGFCLCRRGFIQRQRCGRKRKADCNEQD